MTQKESEIQSEIIEWLDGEGYTYWRSYVGPIVRGGGGKKTRFSKNPMAGYPDITGFLKKHPRQLFTMEVKTDVGKLSDLQKKWIALLREHGVVCIVPRSLEDARIRLAKFESNCSI